MTKIVKKCLKILAQLSFSKVVWLLAGGDFSPLTGEAIAPAIMGPLNSLTPCKETTRANPMTPSRTPMMSWPMPNPSQMKCEGMFEYRNSVYIN